MLHWDFLDLAKLEGALTYGIELQQDACNIACKKHGGRIQHCSFHEAVFDVQFDIITMFGVIEHLTHPEILIDMASMWLVEGGILIIETPNTGSFFAKLLQKYWPPYTPIEHIHYFSENNIRRLLEQYPLIRIETKRHFKKLSIDYVYGMLQTFGTEFHRMLSPLIKLTPDFLKSRRLPFYIGEMLVLAEKHSAKGSSY
jgi:SAM-dependent methyltransferase